MLTTTTAAAIETTYRAGIHWPLTEQQWAELYDYARDCYACEDERVSAVRFFEFAADASAYDHLDRDTLLAALDVAVDLARPTCSRCEGQGVVNGYSTGPYGDEGWDLDCDCDDGHEDPLPVVWSDCEDEMAVAAE